MKSDWEVVIDDASTTPRLHRAREVGLTGPFSYWERVALLYGSALMAGLGIIAIWFANDSSVVVPLALVIFVSYCFGVLLVSRGLDAFRQVDVFNVAVCIAGFIGWAYASTARLTWLSVICVLFPILSVGFNAIRSQGMEK